MLMMVLLGACADGADRGQVVVFAASSLTDAFGEIETEFEALHPDLDVVLNLASSSSLAVQIIEGAPADVFAAAGVTAMQQVSDDGFEVFATNTLAIAVPPGNPAGIEGITDFEREDVRIGLCVSTAPCGELARKAFTAAGLSPWLDTEEPDARALLSKIALGELDAGIVYQTDLSVPGVDAVPFPVEYQQVASYPIVFLDGGGNPGGGAEFVEFVLSPQGRAILAAYGFGLP